VTFTELNKPYLNAASEFSWGNTAFPCQVRYSLSPDIKKAELKAEGRRQKAKGRRQKAEGRRQKAEGRNDPLTSFSSFILHPSSFLLSLTSFKNAVPQG